MNLFTKLVVLFTHEQVYHAVIEYYFFYKTNFYKKKSFKSPKILRKC